jgi:hypothetical protein
MKSSVEALAYWLYAFQRFWGKVFAKLVLSMCGFGRQQKAVSQQVGSISLCSTNMCLYVIDHQNCREFSTKSHAHLTTTIESGGALS